MKEVFLFPPPQCQVYPVSTPFSTPLYPRTIRDGGAGTRRWGAGEPSALGNGPSEEVSLSDLQGDPPSAFRPSFELLCHSSEPQKELSSED